MNFQAESSVNWDSLENHALLNPRLLPEQQKFLLSLLRSECLPELRSHVFLLSSGTTAESMVDFKWVALSKKALLASAQAVNQHLRSDFQDVWLNSLPTFHVGGLGIEARAFLSGARLVEAALDCKRDSTHWNSQTFRDRVLDHHVTLSSLVPAQVFDLVKAQLSCPPSLRAILVGGGAISASLYQSARKLGWPVLPTYGMTETASQVATADLAALTSESLAKPPGIDTGFEFPPLRILPHLEVRSQDEGCFEIRGQSLLSGYIYSSDQGAKFEDPKCEGWLKTQDRGLVVNFQNGEDSFESLHVLGRVGELVKIGGERVEVKRLQGILEELWQQLLVEFPSQDALHADVALIPVPDERLGHVIELVSNPRLESKMAQRLMDQFNVRVMGFERVRKWVVLSEIPRTSLRKLILSDCLKAMKHS